MIKSEKTPPGEDSNPSVQAYIHYHKDGSVWARGAMLNDKMHGYWEWYRKDGVIMRSGYFDRGVQTGEWITYDRSGKPFKVTRIKSEKSKIKA